MRVLVLPQCSVVDERARLLTQHLLSVMSRRVDAASRSIPLEVRLLLLKYFALYFGQLAVEDNAILSCSHGHASIANGQASQLIHITSQATSHLPRRSFESIVVKIPTRDEESLLGCGRHLVLSVHQPKCSSW